MCILVFWPKELFLPTPWINGIHVLNIVAQEVNLDFLVKSGILLMSSLTADLCSLLQVTKTTLKPVLGMSFSPLIGNKLYTVTISFDYGYLYSEAID